MHSFTDRAGRKWDVEIHVAAIKRVKAELEIALAPITPELVGQLSSDDGLTLVAVLFVLCADQAKAAGVTEEDFGRALAGDALDAAVEALLGEMADFTRSPVKRRLWRTALEKGRALEEAAMGKIEARLRSGQLEAKLEEELAAVKEGATLGTMPPNEAPTEPTPIC